MAENDGSRAGASSSPKSRLFLWTPSYFDKHFASRYFINRVVDNLIDAGLGLNDFFFDVKERLMDDPLRASGRIRAIEQCPAAVLFLLWPTGLKDGSNPGESAALLSVSELAELVVLCTRSMSSSSSSPSRSCSSFPSMDERHSTASESMTTAKTPSRRPKIFVVCHQESLQQSSLLPPSLDYALTASGRYPVVRVPWLPGATTSQLRETAAVTCNDLLSLGLSKWCRQVPSALNTRAAWLLTSQEPREGSTRGGLDVKVPLEDDEDEEPVSLKDQPPSDRSWKAFSVYDWSPEMVGQFLLELHYPEVFSMRVEELGLDGFELAILDVNDVNRHLLIDNLELCRILHKKLGQYAKPHSLTQFAFNASKRNFFRVYLIFDPRDSRFANQIRRRLIGLNFEVWQHGQLGRSRSEFAVGQLPKMAQCNFFIILMTETAMVSPFVFEEICLLRSVVRPPASNILSLSWNVGASFYPKEMFQQKDLFADKLFAEEGDPPLPSLLFLIADVENIPLLIHCDLSVASEKISRLVEVAIRTPPPGIVFAAPTSEEFEDVLAPNAANCGSLVFQPLLSSVGIGSAIALNSSKVSGRYGCMISNFLQPVGENESLPFADHRMQMLTSIYITPPLDIVMLCDWVDAKEAAVPLLIALRNTGLKCFADFESPLSPSALVPKARLRLLLLTATSGSLRPSHPLLTAAIFDSTPLLLVVCSWSPVTSEDEVPPRKHSTADFEVTAANSNNPPALVLDMSTRRGISHFVLEICRYLGHSKRTKRA